MIVETALGTRGAFMAAVGFSFLVGLAFARVRPLGAALPGMPGLRHHIPFGKLILFSRTHAVGASESSVQATQR